VAVVAAAGIACGAATFLVPNIAQSFVAARTEMLGLLALGAFVFGVGFLDDSLRVSARLKLAAQLLAAGAACGLGLRIDHVVVPGLGQVSFGAWAWPVTILWIVGVTNALNLIDGLDGLAAGIAAIACGVLSVLTLHQGQIVLGAVLLAMLGSLCGFLIYNFNPARIFLGDCGSMFLGFFLATGSILAFRATWRLPGLAAPLLALGLPVLDTCFSMIRRGLERRSLLAPDRNHLHHRLIDLGLHHRHAVVLMYVVTLLSAGLGMFMLVTTGAASLLVFAGASVPLLLIFKLVGAVRMREAITAFRRNRAIAREVRRQQQGFEEMQLRLRDAETLERWWRALRRTAREMGFARMSVELLGPEGSKRRLLWRLPSRELECDEMICAAIPLRAHGGEGRRRGYRRVIARVLVEIPDDESAESAGRRLALFGRLLDEHGPGRFLGSTARTGPTEASEPVHAVFGRRTSERADRR
jgi:UDP-GlcNAc:undecaprenyl-phosphate GlcNAc-1-phosphate transferase